MIRAAARRRDAREAHWPRGAPTAPWVRWPAPLFLVLTCVLQVATPRTLDLSFLLAAVPPLAALAYGPAATALLGGIVLLLISLPDYDLGHPGQSDTATVAFVAALSVLFAWVRSRRDAQLVTVRTVAEAAQFAVLPPLPDRVGPVRCAGLYRAAQRGTLVGGDLFDVRRGPHGVRAMVGDVQGHGLAAVGTVAALLGAFREAVLDQEGLQGVGTCLDRRLVIDAEEAGLQRRLVIDPDEEPRGGPGELFATAVLLEFDDTARELRFLCFGHPPPLLLRGGAVTELEVTPGAPLGLGIADDTPPEPVVVELEPGDWVLAVTDGVTEARNASGAFYPLVQRLPTVFEAERDDPVAFTDAIWSDLVRFSGGVQDDVALLVFVVGE